MLARRQAPGPSGYALTRLAARAAGKPLDRDRQQRQQRQQQAAFQAWTMARKPLMAGLRAPLADPAATDIDLVVACDDGPRTIRRTTTQPIRHLKANRPPAKNLDKTSSALLSHQRVSEAGARPEDCDTTREDTDETARDRG